jgi:hypothetical protein
MADINQIIRQLQQGVGAAHAEARRAQQEYQNVAGEHALIRQELQRQQRDMRNLADALSQLTGGGSGSAGDYRTDDIRYIESIPGRRIPFDILVSIPIGASVTGEQPASFVVPQDGPFVAVARMATFQSAFQFNRRDPVTGSLATFLGRSFGRFRPIHSAWDVNDAGAGVFQPTVGQAFPGTGACIYASPSNHSSFRTMEFDGVIKFLNQGAGYPRSNMEVPTPFWTTQINSPFQLGAFDFFERGETMQWLVTPTHVNNPDAGNAQQFAAGGVFPFLDIQYDVHEGICDPEDPQILEGGSDPITRLPDGILVVGLHGFKIIQPPGPVAMT